MKTESKPIVVVGSSNVDFIMKMESIKEAPVVARKILKMGPEKVIVTLGKDGFYLLTSTEKIAVPAFPVDAVDTSPIQ